MPFPNPAFLLAPGAGASSAHPRMQDLARLLAPFGAVQTMDYPYALNGKKRPDPLPRLVEAHRAALDALAARHDGQIFLVGKSMGGRVGCHVALDAKVAGLVCFGYPLCGAGDPKKLRDGVLIATRTPVMFVQGTRDPLCPLDLLENVRRKMSAPSVLHVVDGGDHSLVVTKTALKARGWTQADSDERIGAAVRAFVDSVRPAT
ncbi:MAG: alpha/beta family hydrolase [Beijerinckiaceae bacterium]